MEADLTRTGRAGLLSRARFRRGRACLAAVLLLAAAGGTAFGAEPARLVLLSPSDDEQELPGDFLIAISIIDPDAEIDLASIRLYVDEEDVTARATVTSAVVTYVQERPLDPGTHRFELRLADTQGRDLPGLRRSIRVEGPIRAAPEWSVKGRAALETTLDDVSGPGSSLRQEPDGTHTARVQLGGHVSGWNYEGTVFLTSDEDEGYQPRNRYNLHVDHGWVGADVGDVNYAFSPFVLRGKRTRGAGGYVRLGGVEVTALRGAIRRAVEGEVQTESATGDTLDITGATFGRNLVGARLAVGNGHRFQWGLDAVRVRDEVESISAGLLPKDNFVVGSNVLLTSLGQRLILDASAALSFITEDISGGALSAEEIEDRVEDADVPFDPSDYADIFIMNLSTVPLDPRGLSSLALQGGARGNFFGHIFEGRYQTVGSSFASLAAPSIQSDKRGFRATDSFRVLGRRLRILGEVETFRDNLSDDKDYTTDTRIVGLTGAFVPGRPDLQHVTLSLRVYDRENDAAAPTTPGGADPRVDDRTITVRAGTGYAFRLYEAHEVAVGYMRSETDAVNPSADATQDDWSVGSITRFEEFPLVLEVGVGGNATEYPSSGTQVKYTTLRMRGSYGFLDGRLETYAWVTQVAGKSSQGVLGGDKLTLDAGARYRVAARTYLNGRLGFVDFSDDVDPDNDYEENILNLRLVQDF